MKERDGQKVKDEKSHIASLEAEQQKLVSRLLSLTRIAGSLRNRLYELSRDSKALTDSVEKRSPELHALFANLRTHSRTDLSA